MAYILRKGYRGWAVSLEGVHTGRVFRVPFSGPITSYSAKPSKGRLVPGLATREEAADIVEATFVTIAANQARYGYAAAYVEEMALRLAPPE